MANDRFLRLCAATLMLMGSLYLAQQIAKDMFGPHWAYEFLHPTRTTTGVVTFDDLIPRGQ